MARPAGLRLWAQALAILEPLAQSGQRLRAGLGNAFGQDVHRVAFHRAGHHQHMVFVETGCSAGQHLDAHHLRLLDGERTGFVEEHLRDAAKVFQHVLCFDKHAGCGEASGSGDVCHRCGDEQRAGRGQHQHLGESRRYPGHRPCDAGNHQRKHGKGHGQAVSGFYHGRARLLRGGHELEDALVLRIGGHLGGTHGQCSRAVHRPGHHTGAGEHFTRHRLTVDIAQVERGRAGQQLAVNRHSFARQHHEYVAQLHLLDRHRVEAVRGGGSRCRAHAPEAIGRIALIGSKPTPHARQVDDVRGLRRGLHQRGQTALGLGLSVFLNGLAGRDHQRHRPTCPVFGDGHGGEDRDHGQHIDSNLPMTQIVNHAAHSVNHNNQHQCDNQPLAETRIAEYRNRHRIAPRTPIA